jgi:hypothetical protein
MNIVPVKKVPVPVGSHPLGTSQVALPGAARPLGLSRRVDVQDDAGHLYPICALRISIEEAEVRHQMLPIVRRQKVTERRVIRDIRIKRRLLHEVIPVTSVRFYDPRCAWQKSVRTPDACCRHVVILMPAGDHPRRVLLKVSEKKEYDPRTFSP